MIFDRFGEGRMIFPQHLRRNTSKAGYLSEGTPLRMDRSWGYHLHFYRMVVAFAMTRTKSKLRSSSVTL